MGTIIMLTVMFILAFATLKGKGKGLPNKLRIFGEGQGVWNVGFPFLL
jgi:hypothetical protein